MYRILVSDKLGDIGLQRLEQADDASYELRVDLSPEELLDVIPEFDALIIRSGTTVNAELLEAGTKLKVVGRAGIGVDNIDIKTATAKGIIVMNTPQANAIATAEQAIALMLAVSRHLAPAHASLLSGQWHRSDYLGLQIYRKTLGIIGFGRIGRLVAERAQAFGMEVIAYDPYVSEEVGHELGVTLENLDDLLAESDYISLHTVLSTDTKGMINSETIDKMKNGVVIINGARGKLIDENALADALNSGKVRAAAVDVYCQEPPVDNPLIGLSNVLHTPHLGAGTIEAQRDVATQIVDQVLDALRGADFRNTINMPFHAGPDFVTTRPHMELAETIGVLQAALANGPIQQVEVEVRGEAVDHLIRPVAAALLKGVLEQAVSNPVNYINAPVLAEEHGISISQTKGMNLVDYPNQISCRVHWEGGQRLLSGVLFAGSQPRIVQIDDYHVEANPHGIVLIMQNQDVPGVIGQVGTILATFKINVGEWRMGRHHPGSEALSFINLDDEPPVSVLNALEQIPAVVSVKLVSL